MIAEVQCLPQPLGTTGSPYAHVDAAIAVIADSGLTYEVGPLGTSLEGQADEVWRVARLAHEASLAAGASSVVTVLKVAEGPAGPAIADLVAAHR